MTIPNMVKVGGFDIAIRESPEVRDNGNFGQWSPRQLEILVMPDMPDIRKQETICHEVVHAISDLYLDHGLTEAQVRVMGAALHQILRDNPEVTRYLGQRAP